MSRFVIPTAMLLSIWIDPPISPPTLPPTFPLVPNSIPTLIPTLAPTSPPPIQDMCLAITSYWVWDEDGVIYDGWKGQCDEDCSRTGAGYKLPRLAENYDDSYAACIFDWTKLKGSPTTLVSIPDYGDYKCVDNFGDPNYQQPFFHDYYEQWVIPIDLLHPFAHNLVCDWSTGWSND